MDDASKMGARIADDEKAAKRAATLLDLLSVEELDTDLYRGHRNPGGKGRVFGGQVIGQALMAAVGSVEADRISHSLHAYFMRPGNEDYPIIYRVERDYDGGSFSNRRVIAMQRGKPILNMTASFHRDEGGLSHQVGMPDVPTPDALESEASLLARYRDEMPEEVYKFLSRPRAIEMRPVEPWMPYRPVKRPPERQIWFRLAGPAGDDPVMHRAILAYASDMALLSTAMQPHGVSWVSGDVQSASLDHALWLHDDFRADEWLLYVTDSPWAGGARGFNRGRIFSRDGRLVASTAQEGLMRVRKP
ncbi:acyl-CoA thioesterase [Maricaulis sp. CAU 1757]